jgi:hypothetical protein
MLRVAIGFALVLCCGALPAQAAVVISEFLADPPAFGQDANGDGVFSSTQDEFVELYNSASQGVSLAGWSLWDSTRRRHTFAEGAWLGPHNYWVVFGGGTPQGFANASLASTGSLGLNNTADTIELFDALGLLQDQVTYGAEANRDVSIVRHPVGGNQWLAHNTVTAAPFSPGQPTVLPATAVLPEPMNLSLMALGWLGMVLRRRLS